MDTIFVPGNDTDFVLYIKGLGDKAVLTNIDGHFRWVITQEDGSQVIARPSETQ